MASLIPPLERSTVEVLVRKLRGTGTATLHEWSITPLVTPPMNPSTGGLYRVAGTGRDRGLPFVWSLILKIASAPVQLPEAVVSVGLRPDHWNYWRRETFAYQSAILQELPAGIRAPRCLALVEQPGEVVWIWLEDVADVVGPSWPSARYGLTARHLGLFNGAFPPVRVAEAPWLSRNWLHGFVDEHATRADVEYRVCWEHPFVRSTFAPHLRTDILRLWAERDILIAALDRLPHALCHLDAYRPNLIATSTNDGTEETVAIDWAFIGFGTVGEEIVQLVGASLLYDTQVPLDAAQLDELIFENYVAGLREAGFEGDRGWVRFAYAAASALRWGLTMPKWLRFYLDDRNREMLEDQFSRPLADTIAQRATVTSFLVDLGAEARRLLPTLPTGRVVS